MNRLLLLLSAVALCLAVHAQDIASGDTLKYRLTLSDKAATTHSLSRPEDFLSAKAIARRVRQGLVADSTDLPVPEVYTDELSRVGLRVLLTVKWDNTVLVSTNDTALISQALALPFVSRADLVWIAPKPPEQYTSPVRPSAWPTACQDSLYGQATRQIEMDNGHRLHQAGFRGQGMTIAVVDAGFTGVDTITAFQGVRISGTRDFVSSGSVYANSRHGTAVLSCMAVDRPYQLVGTAPEAEYYLLRSEDEASEQLVEEDYWAAAVEYADSVGVDVINSSLGYVGYDHPEHMPLTYCMLDGRQSLASRQASRLAGKGIVLTCSAGNAGDGTWKKIGVPADADNVLTVGAVDGNGILANFSSVGNSADGRVKPDVVAMGKDVAYVNTSGGVEHGNGTSFASPVLCGQVACLWQACPTLTALQLIDLVRQTADRAQCPDNIYGYGLPDVWAAYQSTLNPQP